jgi:histidyl-tRNA synthetase
LKKYGSWNFFWLDRIYLVVEELNLFRNRTAIIKSCLLIDAEAFMLQAIQKITNSGIKEELYPDNAKVAKFQHADKRSIPLQ